MSDTKTCGQCQHFRPDECFAHPPTPVWIPYLTPDRKGNEGTLSAERPPVYESTIACGEFAPVEVPRDDA